MASNEKAAGGVNCATHQLGTNGSATRRVCFLTAVGHHQSPSVARALVLLGQRGLTQSTDVAVVSPGAWGGQNATHHTSVVDELVSLLERAPANLPRVLYLEPLAAHFASPEGWWRPTLPLPIKCAPQRGTARPASHEAASAILLAASARVPPSRLALVEGVWEWTSRLPVSVHPGIVAGRPTDCAHYCIWSGVSEALVDAVAAQLRGPWRATHLPTHLPVHALK